MAIPTFGMPDALVVIIIEVNVDCWEGEACQSTFASLDTSNEPRLEQLLGEATVPSRGSFSAPACYVETLCIPAIWFFLQ